MSYVDALDLELEIMIVLMSLFRSFEGLCGVAVVSLLIVLALKLDIYRVVHGASMIVVWSDFRICYCGASDMACHTGPLYEEP